MAPRLTIVALLLLAGCNASGRPEPGEPGYVPPAPTEATPPAPVTPGPGGEVYSVIPGDSVYGVAERFGVPVRTLIESNGLKPPYRLSSGQQLRVPARQEHVVEPGETLFGIARIYGVDQSSVARLNSLSPPYQLRPGTRLNLPARVEAQVAAAEAAGTSGMSDMTTTGAGSGAMTVEELPPSTSGSSQPSQSSAAPAPAPTESGAGVVPPHKPAGSATPPATQAPQESQTAVLSEPAPRASGKFQWPLKGKLLSSFGPKKGGLHNDGINIAAPRGTEIVAAENGVVAYAGNELRGFGNLLLIRHADGWISAYAHNDTLLVKRGDKVRRGQPIARVGSTGSVTSPQLHFELRRGADPVDPLKYLGSQGAALSPAGAPGARPGPG
ncbi:MAG TPA: LysM peptidoglycan-binding domain-containing M23 family metallopeptidase [Dongiaceae bacterium]|nr:LysM peptidoglycan-binding domain-containing M23 family metallopeptidase [Dongiaceae bacterium]